MVVEDGQEGGVVGDEGLDLGAGGSRGHLVLSEDAGGNEEKSQKGCFIC